MYPWTTRLFSKCWAKARRPMAPESRVGLVWTIGIVLLYLTQRVEAASLPQVYESCTDREKWTQIARYPENLQRMIDSKSNESDDLETLTSAHQIKSTSKNPETQRIALYLFNRSALRLGLVHLAFNGFSNLWRSTPPNLSHIKLASLDCLYEIHQKFQSMEYPADSLQVLKTLNLRLLRPDQAQKAYSALTSLALRKLTRTSSITQHPQELALIPHGSPYESLIVGSEYSLQGNESNVVTYFSKLEKAPYLPPEIKRNRSRIQMNLGRAYYNLGQYDQSISWFSKVDQKSPVFIDSLLGKGWSFIKKEDYKHAIDQAYGLLAFSMKNSFQPEVPLIVAMSAISSCNYASAIDALKIFHKEYDGVYGWLYRWHQNQKNSAQAYNLHQMLKMQMKDKSQKLVPEKVISQWLNSIAFIQAQKELNLVSDEDIATDQIREKIRSESPGKNSEDPLKRSLAGMNINLSNGLSQYQTNLNNMTASLIQKINGELSKINESLIEKWLRAYENSRMIEIEIFTSAKTAKLLQALSQNTEVTAVKGSLSSDSKLPVLDWGRYTLSDNENKEIWEDEIGAIQVDLTNQCKD